MWPADRGKTHANTPKKDIWRWNEKGINERTQISEMWARWGGWKKAAESLSVITWASRERLMWCGGIHNVKKSAQQSASTENDLCFILNKVIQSHRWYVSSASLQFSNCVFIRARSLPRTHTHSHTHSLILSLSIYLFLVWWLPHCDFNVRLSEQSCRCCCCCCYSCFGASSLFDQKRIFGQSNKKESQKKAQAHTHTHTHKRNALTNSTRAIMFIYVWIEPCWSIWRVNDGSDGQITFYLNW